MVTASPSFRPPTFPGFLSLLLWCPRHGVGAIPLAARHEVLSDARCLARSVRLHSDQPRNRVPSYQPDICGPGTSYGPPAAFVQGSEPVDGARRAHDFSD